MKCLLLFLLLTASKLVVASSSLFDLEVGKINIFDVASICRMKFLGVNKVDVLSVYRMDAIQFDEKCSYRGVAEGITLNFDESDILVLVEVEIDGDVSKKTQNEFKKKYELATLPISERLLYGEKAVLYTGGSIYLAIIFDEDVNRTVVSVFVE